MVLLALSLVTAAGVAEVPWPVPEERAYLDGVIETLEEPSASQVCGPGVRAWRAVYAPAFHKPLAITVRFIEGRGELTVSWRRQRLGHALPEAQAKALEDALAAMAASSLGDLAHPAGGMDGIELEGVLCNGAEAHRFRAWSPSVEHQVHRRYFLALLDAAIQAVENDDRRRDLAQVTGYLGGYPVLRYVPGSPGVVVMTGWIHEDAVGRVEAFLAALPEGDVIVDARSAAVSVGKARPFAEFDVRRGRTLWVVNPSPSSFQPEALGIAPSHLAPSMEEARRRLR